MLDSIVKISTEQEPFLAAVRDAMEQYFADDQRRIQHALQVSRYAQELLAYVDADPVLTLTAAYLHDIGIPEAERRHGSSAGNWQELEGPPVAAELLAKISPDSDFVARVTAIVGSHHTAGAIDSPEFRIIWDADALVNFAGSFAGKDNGQIEAVLQKHMATEPGFRMACQLFLKEPAVPTSAQ